MADGPQGPAPNRLGEGGELNSGPGAAIVTRVTFMAMTTRKSTSSTSGQAERPATKAELQRIEERRHIESVLRKGRRIQWPTKSLLRKQPESLEASSTPPGRKEPRPLTPAEKERIAERRHVEGVMRNARRSRLQLRKKLLPSHAGESQVPTAAPVSPAAPGRQIRPAVLLVVAGAVLALALLGLSLSTVIEQGHLAKRLAALQADTAQWRQEEQQSLAKAEQTLQGLAATQVNVQTSLQTIVDGESQLNSKIAALETAQTADSAQQQERLASLEKVTRDGLAQVATRLDSEDSLAASVRKLLPASNPEGSAPQTASEAVVP